MRKTGIAVAFAMLLMACGALAQSDAAKNYQAKCVACHAADGSGSAIGKKLGTHDFHSAEVKNQSGAQLGDAIAKGRNKMPGYEKSLKPDEVKALVAYIRGL